MPIITEAAEAAFAEVIADCPEGKPVVWRIRRVASDTVSKAMREITLVGLQAERQAAREKDLTDEFLAEALEKEQGGPLTEAQRMQITVMRRLAAMKDSDVVKLAHAQGGYVVSGVVDAREITFCEAHAAYTRRPKIDDDGNPVIDDDGNPVWLPRPQPPRNFDCPNCVFGEWEGVRITFDGRGGTLPLQEIPIDTVVLLADAVNELTTGGPVALDSFLGRRGGSLGRDGAEVRDAAERAPENERVRSDGEFRMHAGGAT